MSLKHVSSVWKGKYNGTYAMDNGNTIGFERFHVLIAMNINMTVQSCKHGSYKYFLGKSSLSVLKMEGTGSSTTHQTVQHHIPENSKLHH
jgi:hypothetical protein